MTRSSVDRPLARPSPVWLARLPAMVAGGLAPVWAVVRWGGPAGAGRLYGLSFLGLVVVPFCIGLVYFGFLAQDQFEVETRFAVRGLTERLPGAERFAAGTPLSQIIGLTNSQETYLIADYVRSRALVDAMGARFDLADMFGWPRQDVWARLWSAPSSDGAVAYWRRVVALTIDPVSGVASLRVRAFRKADALDLSRAIVASSEDFLNQRMRGLQAPAIARAEEAIAQASQRLDVVEAREHQFREGAGIIDADKATKATYAALFKLIARKSMATAQLSVLQQGGGGESPTARPLRDAIAAIDLEIDKIKGELSRVGDGEAQTLSRILSDYADVSVQRQFAEEEFAAAQNILQGTLSGLAQRKLFLEPYVPPALPSGPAYPERLWSLLVLLVIAVTVWCGFALIAREIDDHSD